MSCLTRLGCGVVLLLALGAGGAWWLAGGSIPATVGDRVAAMAARLTGEAAGEPVDPSASTAPSRAIDAARWQPVDEAGLERAQDALARLARPGGPARVELDPGDLAAFLATAFARQLPASARAAQVAVVDDRVYVKAEVALADVGGPAVLGPFAGMLEARDTVVLGASVDPLDDRRMQLRVREVVVHDFGVPSALLPRLVQTMRRGDAPAGLAPDAFPLPLPQAVGDVRIAQGRITLYRAASP